MSPSEKAFTILLVALSPVIDTSAITRAGISLRPRAIAITLVAIAPVTKETGAVHTQLTIGVNRTRFDFKTGLGPPFRQSL